MVIQKLSIIIPAYNEENSIRQILDRLNQVSFINNIKTELVIVNDYSSDGTEQVVMEYIENNPDININYSAHSKNQGKGAAIHTGIEKATGDAIIIQDADLEYDPQEINKLLGPMVEGFADVVYGSRFSGGNPHRILFFWHSIGNRLLTTLSNLFTNLNLTDMETCYKLFDAKILKTLKLHENRFGFEPEVTAKISRVPGIRIYEAGISYYGRTYEEGKKISWKDGFWAIWCVFKYNILQR